MLDLISSMDVCSAFSLTGAGGLDFWTKIWMGSGVYLTRCEDDLKDLRDRDIWDAEALA